MHVDQQAELLATTAEAQQRLHYLLDVNLLKRQESIQEQLAALMSASNVATDAVDREDELQTKRKELERISRDEKEVTNSLEETERSLIVRQEAMFLLTMPAHALPRATSG